MAWQGCAERSLPRGRESSLKCLPANATNAGWMDKSTSREADQRGGNAQSHTSTRAHNSLARRVVGDGNSFVAANGVASKILKPATLGWHFSKGHRKFGFGRSGFNSACAIDQQLGSGTREPTAPIRGVKIYYRIKKSL
jgi:hypothetical protein